MIRGGGLGKLELLRVCLVGPTLASFDDWGAFLEDVGLVMSVVMVGECGVWPEATKRRVIACFSRSSMRCKLFDLP
jgi:hypothetical protein